MWFYYADKLENRKKKLYSFSRNQKWIDPKHSYHLEFRAEINEALLDCIKHHYVIIQATKMMEEFTNPYVFIKSLQVTFQVCNLAFTLLKVNE